MKSRLHYFLYHSDNEVSKGGLNWESPLPVHRDIPIEKNGNEIKRPFSIGDYFEAVSDFILRQGLEQILADASCDLSREISKEEIGTVNVTLEKHGQYYHPARVEIEICGERLLYVLNVAVSDPGNDLIKKEYYLLEKLNKTFQPSFLPEVYCLGHTNTKTNQKVAMFLGQWFGGFHEFHLSYDPETGKNRLKVWAPDGGVFLTDNQTANLYQQIAKILTFYYSIDTFEQILSWHHAAGDFVVSVANNDIRLGLITIRNYNSFLKNDTASGVENDGASMLEALLLFMLNMSIRIRLDRLDGVGNLIWSDDIAVKNCLLGFYEGLKYHPSGGLQEGFADVFFSDYLSGFSHLMLTNVCGSLLKQHYQNNEEIIQIQNNLKAHIQMLYSTIQSFAAHHLKPS
jgi:hypothetical protein